MSDLENIKVEDRMVKDYNLENDQFIIFYDMSIDDRSEEEKKKYYLDLVEAMDTDGKFEEEYNYIKDFENKILILEIYKEYNEQKSIRNGGNKR